MDFHQTVVHTYVSFNVAQALTDSIFWELFFLLAAVIFAALGSFWKLHFCSHY